MKQTLIEGKGLVGVEVQFSGEELIQLFITASLLRGVLGEFFDNMEEIAKMETIKVDLNVRDIEAMNCLSSFALKLGSCGTRLIGKDIYADLYNMDIPIKAARTIKPDGSLPIIADPKDFEVQP